MNRALQFTLLGLALVVVVVSPGVAYTSMKTPAHRCSKGSMHVVYRGHHKCLGVATRKLIYYELARWQDTHPGQDVRAHSVVAARFRIPVNAVKVIVVEGLTKGWPLPTSRPVAGTYAGTTTQNAKVTFEVLPGGRALKDFFISTINLFCQPPDVVLFPESSSGFIPKKTVSIAADGAFVIAHRGGGSGQDYVTYQWETRVTGRFSGQGASGGLNFDLTRTIPGEPVATCSAPNATWTALPDGIHPAAERTHRRH